MIERVQAVLADPPHWGRSIRQDSIELGVKDATVLPLAGACVDAIFAFGIVRHIQKCPQAVREAYRLLRPGGVFSCEEFFPDAGPLRVNLALAGRFGIHPYVIIYEREFKRIFAVPEYSSAQTMACLSGRTSSNVAFLIETQRFPI